MLNAPRNGLHPVFGALYKCNYYIIIIIKQILGNSLINYFNVFTCHIDA